MTHTRAVDTRALRWLGPPDGPAIVLLDQTRLPAEEVYLACRDVPALIAAIRSLVVRGAPMLGLAGAYGVALAACRGDDVAAAADLLGRSRPTAVNLGWGAARPWTPTRQPAARRRAPAPRRRGGWRPLRHWRRPGRSTPTMPRRARPSPGTGWPWSGSAPAS